jgi:hypothetical protein
MERDDQAMTVSDARSWLKENHTLVYFLIAQFIAIGAVCASALAYMVKLETRVSTMETRGAAYTVGRMDELKLKLATLENSIEKNERQIDRIVDVMTKRLNINP